MPKDKNAKSDATESRWEVIDHQKVNETVTFFLEIAEKEKIPPKIVALAMDHIVKKIVNYLELEIREIEHDCGESIH